MNSDILSTKNIALKICGWINQPRSETIDGLVFAGTWGAHLAGTIEMLNPVPWEFCILDDPLDFRGNLPDLRLKKKMQNEVALARYANPIGKLSCQNELDLAQVRDWEQSDYDFDRRPQFSPKNLVVVTDDFYCGETSTCRIIAAAIQAWGQKCGGTLFVDSLGMEIVSFNTLRDIELLRLFGEISEEVFMTEVKRCLDGGELLCEDVMEIYTDCQKLN